MPGPDWMFYLLIAAGFYMAWNIGANDVANAMGTSVGSGALTLKRAVILAAILEFSGAFFFGSHVSETVQSGIIDSSVFQDSPMLLVYGMFSSLMAAGLWLQIASYKGWPVSTTHTIIGAVIGFGAIVGGFESVYWDNVAYIVSSWVLSPLLGGLLSFILFNFLRRHIFYTTIPVEAAKRITPFIVFAVILILSQVVSHSIMKNFGSSIPVWSVYLICVVLGAAAALLAWLLLKRIDKDESVKTNVEYALVERIFGYLQIISACLMAFAHGANDVSNAIGPLSAGIQLLRTGTLTAHSEIPLWVLTLGGFGIVIGLATWGWRVIETVGKKITELTPTRGFSAEFGAALTILLASRFGLPVSTTHTLVGSVIGVGLARGIGALDLSTMRHIFASWVVTVPAGAFLAIAIFYPMKLLFA